MTLKPSEPSFPNTSTLESILTRVSLSERASSVTSFFCFRLAAIFESFPSPEARMYSGARASSISTRS